MGLIKGRDTHTHRSCHKLRPNVEGALLQLCYVSPENPTDGHARMPAHAAPSGAASRPPPPSYRYSARAELC